MSTFAPSSSSGVKNIKKRVLCGYGVDIDAVAGWLGSYGGEDSTSDISRGSLPIGNNVAPVSATKLLHCQE